MGLLITAIVICAIATFYPVNTAKILAVLPYQGLSHHMVYLPILRELANRGHDVTVISNFPSTHPNITDISILGSVPLYNFSVNITDEIRPKNDVYFSIHTIWLFYTLGKAYESILALEDVKKLLDGPAKYDLLLAEHFNTEVPLVFAAKFGIPFILLSSCNILPWNEQVVGQSYSLAIKPSTLTNLPPKMNFYGRVMNTISHGIQVLGHVLLCRKRDEASLKKFGMDISLTSLVSKASLIFVNTHFTMFTPRPLVPAVVEIGGVHLESSEPLPAVSVWPLPGRFTFISKTIIRLHTAALEHARFTIKRCFRLLL